MARATPSSSRVGLKRAREQDSRSLYRNADPDTLLWFLIRGEPKAQEAPANESGRRRVVQMAPFLRELLKSTIDAVRSAAIDALGKIGDRDAGPLLVALLRSSSEP